MRTVLVVGIGAGDPEQITIQAIRALNRADVFFVVDKSGAAPELVALRHEILDRYLEPESAARVVTLSDPPRDRVSPAYREAVDEWRGQRAAQWGAAISRELADGDCGAFLVWGDPALYDSTIAVLDEILARGLAEFHHEVIPGISSPQALAARHRIPFNQVGASVTITTGRRLSQGDGDAIVMLDSDCAFERLDPDGIHIYWGAYVGTKDEILVEGPLADVAEEIRRVRTAARERVGWIMDTYLLRGTDAADDDGPGRSRAGE